MAVTIAQFRTRFPEFGTTGTAAGEVPDARVQLALDDADVFLSVYALGPRYDVAQAYMTAHLLATTQLYDSSGTAIIKPAQAGTSSTTTTKKVGEISITETKSVGAGSTKSSTLSFLYETNYGKYVALLIEPLMDASGSASIAYYGAITL